MKYEARMNDPVAALTNKNGSSVHPLGYEFKGNLSLALRLASSADRRSGTFPVGEGSYRTLLVGTHARRRTSTPKVSA